MPVIILVVALTLGAGFGTATSLANALSGEFADLESAEFTTSGWSLPEIVAVALDSGWAWAGLAIAAGWLLTRDTTRRSWPQARAAVVRGAVVGPVALLAATVAYALVDTVRSGAPLSEWIYAESFVWYLASVVFGAPLGVVGACAHLTGIVGLLAKLTLPVGAALQMVVLPPGRNEVVREIGQVTVWTAAALFTLFVAVRAGGARRRTGG
ncbi:hypothetical protein [Herbidospora sp. RD11066]